VHAPGIGTLFRDLSGGQSHLLQRITGARGIVVERQVVRGEHELVGSFHIRRGLEEDVPHLDLFRGQLRPQAIHETVERGRGVRGEQLVTRIHEGLRVVRDDRRLLVHPGRRAAEAVRPHVQVADGRGVDDGGRVDRLLGVRLPVEQEDAHPESFLVGDDVLVALFFDRVPFPPTEVITLDVGHVERVLLVLDELARRLDDRVGNVLADLAVDVADHRVPVFHDGPIRNPHSVIADVAVVTILGAEAESGVEIDAVPDLFPVGVVEDVSPHHLVVVGPGEHDLVPTVRLAEEVLVIERDQVLLGDEAGIPLPPVVALLEEDLRLSLGLLLVHLHVDLQQTRLVAGLRHRLQVPLLLVEAESDAPFDRIVRLQSPEEGRVLDGSHAQLDPREVHCELPEWILVADPFVHDDSQTDLLIEIVLRLFVGNPGVHVLRGAVGGSRAADYPHLVLRFVRARGLAGFRVLTASLIGERGVDQGIVVALVYELRRRGLSHVTQDHVDQVQGLERGVVDPDVRFVLEVIAAGGEVAHAGSGGHGASRAPILARGDDLELVGRGQSFGGRGSAAAAASSTTAAEQ